MTNAITKGTPAQVEWAIKLVDAQVEQLDKMLAPIPAKEDRSALAQKLYGEQIAFVKTVRNTLAKRVQSSKWVIENRNNLVYYTFRLLQKNDSEFNARFSEDFALGIIEQVNSASWLKSAGF